MEYKMLHLFCKNPKQILTRQRLLERLWDAEENYVDEHALTTSIRAQLPGKYGKPFAKGNRQKEHPYKGTEHQKYATDQYPHLSCHRK